MSYFLIVTVIIALLAILYVWYVTRGTHSIPDGQLVPLETEDDKILIHWYKAYTDHSFNFDINDFEIAAKYLRQIYNLTIDPNLLVIGTNLEAQYTKITGNKLETTYSFNPETTDSGMNDSGLNDPGIIDSGIIVDEVIPSDFKDYADYIFDIRSTIGKNGEIAIIHDPGIRNTLRRTNNFDFGEINSIIDSDLSRIARDHLRGILKARWEQIRQLNDLNILNTESEQGAYLYLRIPITRLSETHSESVSQPNLEISSTEQVDRSVVTVLGSISAKVTSRGARINLLCSNYEFEALIKRWSQYLHTDVVQLNVR